MLLCKKSHKRNRQRPGKKKEARITVREKIRKRKGQSGRILEGRKERGGEKSLQSDCSVTGVLKI